MVFTATSPAKAVTQPCQRVNTSLPGNKRYFTSSHAQTENIIVHIMVVQENAWWEFFTPRGETRLGTPYRGFRSRPIGRLAVSRLWEHEK
jgi:hypothetical protein